MSRFLWCHVFALILLVTLSLALEFNEENWSTNASAEDEAEEAAIVWRVGKGDAGFAKDTLYRRNPAGRGNSLKELWEVVPLKQQQRGGIK